MKRVRDLKPPPRLTTRTRNEMGVFTDFNTTLERIHALENFLKKMPEPVANPSIEWMDNYQKLHNAIGDYLSQPFYVEGLK